MKPEMITLKIGDGTLKLPAATVAQFALAAFLGQVVPQQPAPSLPAGAVPPLGANWPGQGGVNAGLMRGLDGARDYYLIVPTGADAEFEDLKYGPRDLEVKGADSPWDGLANTKALIASGKSHPAAEACAAFTRDGHSDFYLPARRELQTAEAVCPEVFSKGWHWSSSQRSAGYAFSMSFGVGTQLSHAKNGELRVRPVRRVFI
ncbi:MAG: DUF1566 domain-containing protein [Pseudomonadaceae bacterium]|nr:DUF1566 domain-containing protein [Pseudomonadaceae bacterium]